MSEVEEARLRLSLAINERPYLGKWFRDADLLKKAKEQNNKEQANCRAVLTRHSGTVGYYKTPPTKGNNFRTK